MHQCRLASCGREFETYIGRTVHENSHIRRGAKREADGSLTVLTPLTPNTAPVTPKKREPGHKTKKVMEVFPSMPARFTIRDVMAALPQTDRHNAKYAIQWSASVGIIKQVGKLSYEEQAASGHRGAPPFVYEYVGNGLVTSGHEKKTLVNVNEQQQAAPVIQQPDPQQILLERMELSHNAIRTLQSAAALAQFSVILEQIGPEAAIQMLAGMSKMHLSRR